MLIPKVESADAVRQALALLDDAGGPADLPLWCMMETPRAMLRAAEIAAAHPRLACLVMGTSDLAKELHAAHTPLRLPLLTALGLCLPLRACGLAILDGVHLDLEDDAVRGRVPAGRGTRLRWQDPDPSQADRPRQRGVRARRRDAGRARRIIAAHEQAARDGQGVVVVDGKLVEHLHVVEARRQVHLAEAIAAMPR